VREYNNPVRHFEGLLSLYQIFSHVDQAQGDGGRYSILAYPHGAPSITQARHSQITVPVIALE
jgi:hypothetical protein